MANPAPVIGEWFRRTGGDSFEVVAIDQDDRTIEIQYFDGTIEELEFADWFEEPIEATEAPEDWTGSVDVDAEDTENEYEAEPGVIRAETVEFLDALRAAGLVEFAE